MRRGRVPGRRAPREPGPRRRLGPSLLPSRFPLTSGRVRCPVRGPRGSGAAWGEQRFAPVPLIRDTVWRGLSPSPEAGCSCPRLSPCLGRVPAQVRQPPPWQRLRCRGRDERCQALGSRAYCGSDSSACSWVTSLFPRGNGRQVSSGGVSPALWLVRALTSCGFSVLGTALEESFKEYGRNREAMRLCREGELIQSWREVHGEVFPLITSYKSTCVGKRRETSILSLWIWDLRPVSEWCH